MIKLLMADDHPILIEGIISMITPQDGIQIVCEANDGESVLPLLRTNKIDIAVLDIEMPRKNGIQLVEPILKEFPKVKILILSMHQEHSYIERLIKLGVHGYVLKDKGKDLFIEAVKTIFSGKLFFDSTVSDRYIKTNRNRKQIEYLKFTKRELEVLKLLSRGKTSGQVSEMLYISSSTVDTHRRNLLEKTNSTNVVELTRFAIKHGYDN